MTSDELKQARALCEEANAWAVTNDEIVHRAHVHTKLAMLVTQLLDALEQERASDAESMDLYRRCRDDRERLQHQLATIHDCMNQTDPNDAVGIALTKAGCLVRPPGEPLAFVVDERDVLRDEVARMRPVYECAKTTVRTYRQRGEVKIEPLFETVDAALAKEPR